MIGPQKKHFASPPKTTTKGRPRNEVTREFILSQVVVDPVTGCWNWPRSINSNGYGTFEAAGEAWTAHRAAWVVFRGPVPHGLLVLHHCDNPRCCNPAHLWKGTQRDNMWDCWRKGRMPMGRNPKRKPRERISRHAVFTFLVRDVLPCLREQRT